MVGGVHEPIVSKETFAKAEERLKKNAAYYKTRSDSRTVYLLTGPIKCPDCGKNILLGGVAPVLGAIGQRQGEAGGESRAGPQGRREIGRASCRERV